MNHADEILIVLLSVVLIILLLLLIWIAVYALKVIHGVKRVVDDAGKVIDSAETVGEVFRKTSGPISLLNVVTNLGYAVNNQRNKQKGGNNRERQKK